MCLITTGGYLRFPVLDLQVTYRWDRSSGISPYCHRASPTVCIHVMYPILYDRFKLVLHERQPSDAKEVVEYVRQSDMPPPSAS